MTPILFPAPKTGFRRTRTTATILLLLAAALFLASTRYQAAHPALAYVRAFAEAATIGGLADWFAVVALFRRPFGLPIPHTAIIPANKARIGRSLGDFIGDALLTDEVLGGLIDSLDLPPQAGRWLAEEENAGKLADWLIAQGPLLSEMLKSGAWQERLIGLAAELPLGALLTRGLSRAAAAGLHDPWVDAALDRLGLFLREHQDDIRHAVAVHSSRWIPEWVDVKLADRLSDAVIDLLQHLRQPDHRWRGAFDRLLQSLPDRLAEDPVWQEEAARCQHMLFADPALRAEAGRLIEGIAARLGVDRDGLSSFLRRAGTRLADDPVWQRTLRGWMHRVAGRVLVPRKQAVGGFVATMIAGWDDKMLVTRLEAEVGADLQFIRLNGTLVGGVVGLILYTVGTWLN